MLDQKKRERERENPMAPIRSRYTKEKQTSKSKTPDIDMVDAAVQCIVSRTFAGQTFTKKRENESHFSGGHDDGAISTVWCLHCTDIVPICEY